jgi:hypothetical protein
VRDFVIGTNQQIWGGIVVPSGLVSTYDDGLNPYNGATTFTQTLAFTCHIVAAKVVQCIHGLPNVGSTGQWASGTIFVEYGDSVAGLGRIASLMGYAGGQSFPIGTPGSGQTPGLYTVQATSCTVGTGSPAGVLPNMDITVGSGGTVTNAYPSHTANGMGFAIGSTPCVFTVPGSAGGTPGVVTTPVAPVEGVGGVATYNTDTNLTGILIYDNSMEPGNPLNSFQSSCPTSSGYCEPGMPVLPFGQFLGAQVSG